MPKGVETLSSQLQGEAGHHPGNEEVCADDALTEVNYGEALFAEVLERQGVRETVQFSTFRDIDSPVETCQDWAGSDIVASVATALSSSASDDEDDDGAHVPCPTFAEAARALDVIRMLADHKGQTVQLSRQMNQI